MITHGIILDKKGGFEEHKKVLSSTTQLFTKFEEILINNLPVLSQRPWEKESTPKNQANHKFFQKSYAAIYDITAVSLQPVIQFDSFPVKFTLWIFRVITTITDS